MVPLPMKWDQLETVDYSYPARFEEYRLMQKYPKEESRFTAILKPFSTSVASFFAAFESKRVIIHKSLLIVKVWICSIAMVVVFIIILTIFTIFNPEWIENGRKLSVWEHLSRHFEYVICIIAYQGPLFPFLPFFPSALFTNFTILLQAITCQSPLDVPSSFYADSGER